MKRSSKKSKRSSASVSASARHDEGDESVAVIVRLRPEAGSEAAICLRRRDATTLELRAPHDHRAQDATASSLAPEPPRALVTSDALTVSCSAVCTRAATPAK